MLADIYIYIYIKNGKSSNMLVYERLVWTTPRCPIAAVKKFQPSSRIYSSSSFQSLCFINLLAPSRFTIWHFYVYMYIEARCYKRSELWKFDISLRFQFWISWTADCWSLILLHFHFKVDMVIGNFKKSIASIIYLENKNEN